MAIINFLTVKAAKQHRCDWCGLPITKGEVYQRSANKYDGIFYTWKNHLFCQKAAQELNMFDDVGDEGVTEEDFDQTIQSVYSNIMSEKHNDLYESEEFELPDFRGQYIFVLDDLGIEHSLKASA